MKLDEFCQRHALMDRLLADSATIRDIHRIYALIDGKCSALIGHVSLMIAATTFLHASAELAGAKAAYLIEAALYLVIAVLLLGTIGLSMYKFPLPPDPQVLAEADVKALEAYFGKSCNRRVNFYMAGHIATIVLTVAVISTVAWSLLPP